MVTSLLYRDWILLVAAGALLFNAASGVIKGSAIVFFRTVKRADDPKFYWFAVFLSAALGIGGAVILTLQWTGLPT